MNDTVEDPTSAATGARVALPRLVVLTSPDRAAPAVLAPPVKLDRTMLADERLSREHASVEWNRGVWRITDLGSRNGTFLDGVRVTSSQTRHGDAILRLGHTVFALIADGRGHPTAVGDPVVGPELQRAYDQIRAHAAIDRLLLYGESGSGKELAARLYHAAGPRKAGAFVAVNCAAIPEGVAERLLFGSRKGAFSGAVDAPGHFQLANGGTLFLDEIAELDPQVQAKVLRAIESHEVMPVGGTMAITVDIGIVAASHRELRAAVAERKFRDDLYYRLAAATVHLPPLRERRVDIARLIDRELALFDPGFSAHAKLVELCCIRPWPGNIRELRAAIRQAAIAARMADRRVVRVEDLATTAGVVITAIPGGRPTTADAPVRSVAPAELDRDVIVAAMERANGVLSVAARELGLHRTQLYRLLERHGIAR